jgi:hypothetical protein
MKGAGPACAWPARRGKQPSVGAEDQECVCDLRRKGAVTGGLPEIPHSGLRVHIGLGMPLLRGMKPGNFSGSGCCEPRYHASLALTEFRACSPLLPPFTQKNFRGRLFPASRQLPQVGG